MDNEKLNVYLDEIGATPLLSEDEERRLSQRVKAGDGRALDKLVRANLRLVVSVARQYRGRGLSMDDLVGEGNIGLMKAAAKFDGERGLRFAGYAPVFVRRQIERALSAESGERRVETRSGGQTRSVDAPLGSKANVSLLSVLVNDSAPMADQRVHSGTVERAVEHALASLHGREADVVASYFGIEQEHRTMQEIADAMGLKRERVRQIRDRAVRRLRKAYKMGLREML